MKKHILTIVSAVLGLMAILASPSVFSQAQYAMDLGVYPQCSGCHDTTDDSSGNGGNSRNRLRGSVWYQCTPPQILNDAKNLCVFPPVTPTCTNGQVLNATKNVCETPTPVVPVCVLPQVLNSVKNVCETPVPKVPVCSNGQVLNATKNVCETPTPVIPVCVLPQVLNSAKNVCETPAPVVPVCVLPQVLNAATKDSCFTPTPSPAIPVCVLPQVLNSAKTACVTPAPVVPVCSSGQVLNAAKTACVVIPTCATGSFLNAAKTDCVAPPVIRANTKPVLNAVAQQWDAKVGELITIPLSVKDAEQDVFAITGSVAGSKFSTVHPDAAGLPSIDFLWTPTATQVNKIYTVVFQAKETKTTQKLVSNKVSVKIRVWAAGDRNSESITKLNVMTSVWRAGNLNLAGNVVLNKLLTASERQAFINQKLDLTVSSNNGTLVGSAALTLDAQGNWSAVLPIAQTQTPCSIILQYDGQKASRTVIGCVKSAAIVMASPIVTTANNVINSVAINNGASEGNDDNHGNTKEQDD